MIKVYSTQILICRIYSSSQNFKIILNHYDLDIDLDNFKHINDVYGHAFGDQVLIDIAQAIGVFQNKVDLISRTGGEEFEVVIRGLDEPAALRLAEAIREQIAALQSEQGPKISASLGVALSHSNEAISSLRQRADAAAYQAKQAGRNRVQLAT